MAVRPENAAIKIHKPIINKSKVDIKYNTVTYNKYTDNSGNHHNLY